MKVLFLVSAVLFAVVAALSIGGNLLGGLFSGIASLSALSGFFVVRSREAKA